MAYVYEDIICPVFTTYINQVAVKVDVEAVKAQLEVKGGADRHIIKLEQFNWAARGDRCLRGCLAVSSVILGLLDVQ